MNEAIFALIAIAVVVFAIYYFLVPLFILGKLKEILAELKKLNRDT